MNLPNHLVPKAATLSVLTFGLLILLPTAAVANDTGCADGQREGFAAQATYPNIAGCGGAWSIRGVANYAPAYAPSCPQLPVVDTRKPACNRTSGDDSANAAGSGCNAEDLCEAGWHICLDANDIRAANSSACGGATVAGDSARFFVSRQATTGCGVCADGTGTGSNCNSASCAGGCANTASTTNDVYGCGNIGAGGSCSGSSMVWTGNLCDVLEPHGWNCNDPSTSADDSGLCETYTMLHTNPATGGVVCCRDSTSPDSDKDGVKDSADNCPFTQNANQLDTDVDGVGDACECLNVTCSGGDSCNTAACDSTIGK